MKVLPLVLGMFVVVLPILLISQSLPDSLYIQSKAYLDEALAIEGDFDQQAALAQKAVEGFRVLGEDSLLIEAYFIITKAAYYNNDSLAFVKAMEPTMSIILSRRDTAAIVRAYNRLGMFYFSQGNSEKGLDALKTPDQRNYYSATSLSENVFNLGALIDIGLGYTMNLDTVYAYVNKLQALAQEYDDPSVQVVSRFKLAQLFSKAYNYKEALNILRGAYPYLDKLDNQGFLHYYYNSLINNFIYLDMPDSASHYIDILQRKATYPPGDPRNCYAVVTKARANIALGKTTVLSEDFETCYNNLMADLEVSQKADSRTLNAIFTKCAFLLAKKEWQKLNELLDLLIQYAERTDNNLYLESAYEMKYKALIAQGRKEEALEAHIKFKEYSDKISQFVFSQSQALIRNQMSLKLATEENHYLQVENQNQKLLLEQDRNIRLIFLMGLLSLGLLVAYFVNLAYTRGRRSRELSRMVKNRTAQLEAANENLMGTNKKLLASNTELERFAFIASHDLKTPLHNIIKFAGLLEHKLASNKVNEMKEYLSFIITGGKRMNNLIEDVLEYSKLSNNETEGDKVAIDLEKLIREVSDSISEYLTQRNAVVMAIAPLPHIHWHYSKIFILFKNLIENSIKYNESVQPTVKVYAENTPEYCCLCFEDNGIGIAKAYQNKVFEMFTRLHNQEKYEGSGMGLATCRKIIEEMKGTIEVASEVGLYTIFKVKLPNQWVISSQENEGRPVSI